MTTQAAPAAPNWRPSSLATIEDDLKALWQEAAREAPVAHAIMSNLVIISTGPCSGPDRTPEPRETLVRVAERHPARVVLLDHRQDPQVRQPRAVRAGLVIFGGKDHRYGVEVIGVAMACADASVPSVIRSLVRGDVPTSVWIGGDLSTAPPAAAILAAADQLIYESGDWGDVRQGFRSLAALLAGVHPPALIDLTWRGLADMRGAIRTGVEPLPEEAVIDPSNVSIQFGTGRESSAWLLWGWLATRLNWRDRTFRGDAAADGIDLRVQLHSALGSVEVNHLGSRITVRDAAGHLFDVSPTVQPLADAIADALLDLERDAAFEETVRSCAIW